MTEHLSHVLMHTRDRGAQQQSRFLFPLVFPLVVAGDEGFPAAGDGGAAAV